MVTLFSIELVYFNMKKEQHKNEKKLFSSELVSVNKYETMAMCCFLLK